jgi:putative thioredoxin
MSESSGLIFDVSESTFLDDVLARSAQVPVVVGFWAPWNPPSRALSLTLARLVDEGGGGWVLAKVNVDHSPRLSAEYGVRALPAVKVFREGQVVAEFSGLQPEPKVREFLRRVAPSAVDKVLVRGASLLATRHWAEAEGEFRQALDLAPGSGQAALGLLKSLLAQGEGDAALDTLDEFPRSDEGPAAESFRALAGFLAHRELEGEDDNEALYRGAARLFARGQIEASLDGLLDLLRQNKRFRNGAARQVVLGIFALLGDDDAVTVQYRSELASVLF